MGQAIVLRIRFPDRYELKYLLDRNQYEQVAKALATHMEPDAHSEGGRYLVTSLYYDTADYKAYWEKINGYRFRRKVRVRVYNTEIVSPDSLCFVEIKHRRNKTLQKKRVVLPYSTAVALCGSGKDAYGPTEADRLVIEEVLYLYNTLRLQPACVVSYDRLAFEGSEYDPGLRVTFDTNLKCRTHDLTLLSQGYAEKNNTDDVGFVRHGHTCSAGRQTRSLFSRGLSMACSMTSIGLSQKICCFSRFATPRKPRPRKSMRSQAPTP